MAGLMLTQGDINRKTATNGKPLNPAASAHVQEVQQELSVPEYVEPEIVKPEEKPGFFNEVLPAAFRLNNSVYGMYHDAAEAEYHPIDLSYKETDHLEALRKDVPSQYWGRLAGKRSLGEAEKEKKDILKEIEDKKVLQKAGAMTSLTTELVATLADPVTLIGGYGEALALKTLLTKGHRVQNFLKSGAVAGLIGSGQEALLQTTTHTKDSEDILYNGIFAAGIGGALGQLYNPVRDLKKELLEDMDRRLVAQTPMEYMSRAEAIDIASKEPIAEFPRMNVVQRNKQLQSRVDALLEENKKAVDAHEAKRLEAKGRVDTADAEILASYKSLYQPDRDMYDDAADMAAEFVNGVKGVWTQITKNDGSTLAMFVPWEDRPKIKSKKVVSVDEPANAKPTEEVKAEVEHISSVADEPIPERPRKDVLDADGNVVPEEKDILERAVEMEAKGVFKGNTETKTAKVLLKAGFTDSSWLAGQNSPVSKLIDHELLSSASGITSSAGTAAVRKFQHLKVMLSTFMPDLSASYKTYAHNNNISHWNIPKYYGEGMESWNREIRIELEKRRNAFLNDVEHTSTAAKEIQEAADALQRAADHALDVGKASGIRGFEDIVRTPGYVPLLWSGKALRKLGGGDEVKQWKELKAYESLLAKGYVSALGLEEKDAKVISKAVMRRALYNDVGLDANTRNLFSADARGFLRKSLEEGTDLSEHKINELFARIDARQGDKGTSARAKRRTEVDLLITDEEGRSLINIVDNDLPMIFNRYSSEMSGRAALAQKGITSEADWTRLRERAVVAAVEYGDDHEKLKKILDSTYEQFLGRPAGGGVNKNVRRLMDMATVASLGQVGFAQMAEWAPILATHGITGMYEVLPAVRSYRQAIKNGTIDKGVLGELEVHYGRISEEEMLFRPDLRLDDKLSDDPEWLRIIDKGLGTLNNVSGKLSLMHQIKSMQQQFVVALQANKVAQAVQKGEWDKLEKRFSSLGWDTKFMQELKEVSKHFEFENGTLQRLNIDKWRNPVLTDKFIQGLHIHTNRLVQNQMIGETAYWMHPTIGAMLTQFRTFPLVAMEKQTARHMLMADEESMFTAMYGLGLSSMVYAAKVAFNAQGKGSDKQQYLNDRLSMSSLAKGALQYANVAGPIQDVSNLAVAAGLAPKFMSSSNVGRQGGDKMANLSIADVPSLGTGLKVFNAATGIGKGLLDPEYDYKKRDLQNIQGAMPLGNTPFLTIPWNIAKDHID